jgi:hypothetical protein
VIGGQPQSVTATFARLAVGAALQRATVVKTGRNYATRQVQIALRATEVVSVRLRVRRGNATLAQRTIRNFGPGIALAVVNLRRSVTPGRAQVQATFTNSVGTTKIQNRNITIPR